MKHATAELTAREQAALIAGLRDAPLPPRPPSPEPGTARDPKNWSSVVDANGEARGRLLEDPGRVYQHNAWDHVEWDPEQLRLAEEKVARQREQLVSVERQADLDANASEMWNKFYTAHEAGFFKDRNWFRLEFPELFTRPAYLRDDEEFRVLEVGCGAGNTVFPVMKHHEGDGRTRMFAFDYSHVAVDLVKNHPDYDASRCTAFVHDLSSPEPPSEIPPNSLDIIVMVFVLSALNPVDFTTAVRKLHGLLRPGGYVLFRDYGRHDLAQLRFKPGRMLSEGFYTRGDGTRVYFFEQEELARLFGKGERECDVDDGIGAGAEVDANGDARVPVATDDEPLFEIVQNAVDRRLLVNRLRKLQMYRVWMQGKYRKPLSDGMRGSSFE